jgi:Flp pilus assembly pilin Flp
MIQSLPLSVEGAASRARTARKRPGFAVRAFHDDEQGLNIIEIILIIFVAMIILFGLWTLFDKTAWPKVKKSVTDLLGITSPT